MKNIPGLLFPCLLTLLLSVSVSLGAGSVNPVPIPPAEQNLPAETAVPWLDAAKANDIMEGAIFDSAGDLLFCDVSKRRIMKLKPEKRLETLLQLPELGAGGLAWHKDGRLFMAVLDLARGRGAILAWTPETGRLETIVPPEAGYWPNDLVFSPAGGFYFSNFRRSGAKPAGGIYYVAPDFKSITPVITNMDQANGVALSPDGKTLWATEFAKNRLHRAILANPVTILPTGSAIPYHFTGSAPDSMRVDSEGNVYVALYGQGRVMIFNGNGIPIGQILLPEREKGKNLLSTSLAISPESQDMFIVSSNEEEKEPARIFKARSLARGLPPTDADR